MGCLYWCSLRNFAMASRRQQRTKWVIQYSNDKGETKFNQAKRSKINEPTVAAPTDIVMLVNTAWEYSFARTDSNKKAIAKRGWFSFNRNLFTIPKKKASRQNKKSVLNALPCSSLPISRKPKKLPLSTLTFLSHNQQPTPQI